MNPSHVLIYARCGRVYYARERTGSCAPTVEIYLQLGVKLGFSSVLSNPNLSYVRKLNPPRRFRSKFRAVGDNFFSHVANAERAREKFFFKRQRQFEIKGTTILNIKILRLVFERVSNLVYRVDHLRWNDMPRTSRIFCPKIAIFSQL